MGGTSNGQMMRRVAAENAAAAEAASLPQLIGQAVAIHLAPVMQQLAGQLSAMPDCFACVREAARLVHDYQVKVSVAGKAAEPAPPAPPPPQVAKAVTWVPVAQITQTPAGPAPFGAAVPMCFAHVPAGGQAPASVGLVDLAGNPISYRRP